MNYKNLVLRAEYAIASGRLTLIAVQLEGLLRKYAPDQPRIPAGQPTGGQWVGLGEILRIAGKWNETNRAECELQYESDILQCRVMLWNPFCEDQARSRMTACMKGNPIPPFFHVGDAR
jgi:hypothetical protein